MATRTFCDRCDAEIKFNDDSRHALLPTTYIDKFGHTRMLMGDAVKEVLLCSKCVDGMMRWYHEKTN